MKIPYTFVLLSSCVMISSAMAMIEPGDGEAATTSTTTLPLVHAPAAPALVAETATDTGLHTAPPAFDPTATEDDRISTPPRRLKKPQVSEDDDSTDSEDSALKRLSKMPQRKAFVMRHGLDLDESDES